MAGQTGVEPFAVLTVGDVSSGVADTAPFFYGSAVWVFLELWHQTAEAGARVDELGDRYGSGRHDGSLRRSVLFYVLMFDETRR